MSVDFAAPHIGFVIASYAISAAVIAGMIAAVLSRYRATARRLADLEAKGAPRRRKTAEQGA